MKKLTSVDYRVLSRAEIAQLAQIERAETIERVYTMRDGNLVLKKEHWDVPDWGPEEKQQRIAALQDERDAGATVLGAFDGPTLVGMSVLDRNPLSSGVARFNLAGLWVSHTHRNQGIGKMLVQLAVEEAKERGAKTLYVSATPSENTIRFYTSLGFRPAETVDPHLFEDEPEDIHLELILQSKKEKRQC
ncbi:MAG: GNAT family N-acetyltransferase [Anaerolineae bacterium]|jgi:predicted N-acetyltransferase YhbS